MSEMGLALMRSLRTLGRGRVWLLLIGPAVLALVLWVGLAVFFLERLIDRLVEQPPLTWLAGWGALWLAKLLAALGGWVLILSAVFVTAMLLAAIWVMPRMLELVAAKDYPELAQLGRNSLTAAIWNGLSSVLLFAVGWLLTLPLWWIPGMGLLLSIFWMAWLTRRTFAFDALALHATDQEWRALRAQHAGPWLLLGVVMALLTHLPFLGLLAPTLAALVYAHYGLEALRRLRQGAVVAIIDQPPQRS